MRGTRLPAVQPCRDGRALLRHRVQLQLRILLDLHQLHCATITTSSASFASSASALARKTSIRSSASFTTVATSLSIASDD